MKSLYNYILETETEEEEKKAEEKALERYETMYKDSKWLDFRDSIKSLLNDVCSDLEISKDDSYEDKEKYDTTGKQEVLNMLKSTWDLLTESSDANFGYDDLRSAAKYLDPITSYIRAEWEDISKSLAKKLRELQKISSYFNKK